MDKQAVLKAHYPTLKPDFKYSVARYTSTTGDFYLVESQDIKEIDEKFRYLYRLNNPGVLIPVLQGTYWPYDPESANEDYGWHYSPSQNKETYCILDEIYDALHKAKFEWLY